MRITVSLIVKLVENGMNTQEILPEYPDLEPEDVSQALQYAASLAPKCSSYQIGIGNHTSAASIFD